MKILPLLFLTFLINTAHGQPTIQWQKAYGGTANDVTNNIQQTTDGGYVFIGATTSIDGNVASNHGANDVWVVKLTATGSLGWERTYGGVDGDNGTYIEQTKDGGYIFIATVISDNGDITHSYGGADIWVVKLDGTGNITWQKNFGGSLGESSGTIHQLASGGYIFVGTTTSIDHDVIGNHGGSDIWVVSIDASGNINWSKTYGGTGNETGVSIEQTKDGGFIVGATTNSTNGDVTVDYGGIDEWVLKLTSTGTLSWQKNYGGTGADFLYGLHQTKDGGYISAGSTQSKDHDVTGYHDTTDVWVVKMDSIGNVSWEKTLGGKRLDVGTAITEKNSEYIVGGYTQSTDGDVSGLHGVSRDIWLVDLSPTGAIKWTKTIGGTALDIMGGGMVNTTDGGIAVGGSTYSIDGDATGCGYHPGSGSDSWIIKFNTILDIAQPKQTNGVTVYPTVTNESFFIKLEDGIKNADIVIFDILGRQLNIPINGDQLKKVDISKQSNGMYLVEIICNSQKYYYRVIKN